MRTIALRVRCASNSTSLHPVGVLCGGGHGSLCPSLLGHDLLCRYDKYLQSERPKAVVGENKGDKFDRELGMLEQMAEELSEV